MIVQAGPSLKLVSIAGRGNLAEERVHFQVERDCDSSLYVVLATISIGPGRVYAGGRPAYWFEQKDLKFGDSVIIYSKAGTYVRNYRNDGHFNHFFYWGVREPLFTAPTACVVIGELNSWIAAGP